MKFHYCLFIDLTSVNDSGSVFRIIATVLRTLLKKNGLQAEESAEEHVLCQLRSHPVHGPFSLNNYL